MTTDADLLPPNATPLERSLSLASARLGAVPVPLRELWDPWECPLELLPWLAWSLSIERWEADWSEYKKRTETARAIELQRLKGTPASMDELLESYDRLIRLVEWFQQDPPGDPYTFQVIIPIDGTLTARSTSAFAQQIVRDIYRTKPARAHFELWLELASKAGINFAPAAHTTVFRRLTMRAATGLDFALIAEDGQLLLDEDGNTLEVG